MSEYKELNEERLRKVIEDVLASEPTKSNMKNFDNMIKFWSPEAKQQFDDAVKAEINGWKIQEDNTYIDTGDIKSPVKLLGTGKSRNKMLHLKPKKKKRKR
jgi:hypothetical protein